MIKIADKNKKCRRCGKPTYGTKCRICFNKKPNQGAKQPISKLPRIKRLNKITHKEA